MVRLVGSLSRCFAAVLIPIFLISCGQQSTLKGPYQRVEWNDYLNTLTQTLAQTFSGICESSAPLVINSPGLASPINTVCTSTGTFAVPFALTGPDGTYPITVSQTDPTGGITTDIHNITLDQNPPVLTDDTPAAVSYGSPSLSSILVNDTDAGVGINPTSLTIAAPAPASDGICSLSFGATAGVQFTPARGFSGTTSCSYEVCDSLNQCSTALVNFSVSPGSPIVVTDNTTLGTQNFTSTFGAMTDDTDPDGPDDIDYSTGVITGSLPNAATEGVCSVGPGPVNVSFTPVTNYFGTAVCTYQLCDFEGNCDTGDMSFIIPDQTLPLAVKDTGTVLTGAGPISIDVSLNDSDPAGNLDSNTVSILSSVGGNCDFNTAAPNVRFTPNPGFVGTGSCSYNICDSSGNCASSLFEVTVNDGQAPTINPDFTVTDTNIPTAPINVASNDFDPENRLDLASVTITGTPTNGTCAVSPSSPFIVFTPTANLAGTGTCDYQICDLTPNCATGTVTVTIVDVVPPIVVTDVDTTIQNTPTAAFDVSANDSDPEGNLDPASVILTNTNVGGSCTLSPASPNVVFTPDLDFAGIGSCSYRICDTAGNCSNGKYEVTVNDVTAPTVTINQLASQADPTGILPIIYEVMFSEPIDTSTFNSSDLDLTASTTTGGVYSIINSGDNINFTIVVNALSSDGDLEISIPASGINDVNGVANTASTSTDNVVTYDGTAPQAPIFTAPYFTQDGTPDIDISCEPGSIIQISTPGISPDPYPALGSAPVCPAGGSVTLAAVPLPGGGIDGTYNIIPLASDAAGNTTPGAQQPLVVDNSNPSLVIEQLSGQLDPTKDVPIFFLVTFDEQIDPTTFTGADINNAGTATGGVWTVANSGDNQTFTISVNALTGNGSVNPQVGAGLTTDLAGNVSLASVDGADNLVDYDAVPPGLPIVTGPAYTQDDTPDITIVCESNENLELIISGYAANPVTGVCVGGVATITLPLALPNDGTYTMIPTAIDAVGNSNQGSAFDMVLDRDSPAVTWEKLPAQVDPTNSLPLFFIVSFSEPIDASTFTGSDITNGGTASGGVWSVSNNGDDQNFTVSVSALGSNGTAQPVIPANMAQDLAGNLNLAATLATGGDPDAEYDGVPPGAPVITGPAYTQDDTPDVTLVCDGNENLELNIAGYASSPVTAPCVSGLATITLPATLGVDTTYTIIPTAIDGVGNRTDGNAFNLVLDRVPPDLTWERLSSQADPTNTQPIFFSVVFSEPINAATFSGLDITNSGTAAGGVWSVSNNGDDTNFTISISGLTGDGTVQPAIAANLIEDRAVNLNTAATLFPGGDPDVLYDGTAPVAPIITGPAYTQNDTPDIQISCETNENIELNIAGYASNPVTGVCVAGVATITLPATLGVDGPYVITPTGIDAVGNSTNGNAFTVNLDRVGPSVTIGQLASQADPTKDLPIFFDVIFNEPIDAATFSGADIVNGGTASGGVWTVTNSGDNQTFSVSVSALTSSGTVNPSLLGGVVIDLAANPSLASTSSGDDVVTFDIDPPSIPVVLSPSFTASNTPTVDVNCEVGSIIELSITGYTPNPVPGVLCAASPLSILLPGPLPAEGTYSITPIATDNVGNTTSGAAFDMVYDATSPNVEIQQLASQSDPTNSLPIFFEVTFDEAIDPSTFTISDITNSGTASGGIWSLSNSGNNTNFTLSINGLTSDGTVVPSLLAGVVADPTGNLSTASAIGPNDNSVTYDGTAPTPPIVTAPAYTNTLTPTIDVSCETGSLMIISISGYTPDPFPASPVTCVGGVASIALPGPLLAEGPYAVTAISTDAVGNTSLSSPFNMVADITAPDVEITRASSQVDPTNSQPISFDVIFSEAIDPSTFTAADIVNVGPTAGSGAWTITNSGDNTNFTISLSSLLTDGLVEPQIAANLVTDLSTNLNTASTTPGGGDPDVDYDGTAPGTPIMTAPRYTSDSTPQIDITCETGSLVQVAIAGYMPSPFPATPVTCVGGVAAITLTTSLPADGDYLVTPIASDAVGNQVLGAVYTLTLDSVDPDVTITRLGSQADPTNSEPVYFEVAFSEPILASSFVGGDITDVGTLGGAVWSVTNTGDNQNFIISANALAGTGTIVPQLAVGAVEDLAANLNTTSTTPGGGDPDVEFDNQAPTNAEILAWGWTLSSPNDGDISSDGTPIVGLSAAASENGADVQIFDDSTCTSSKGSAQTVAGGAANMTDITYFINGSEDGPKVFYAKVTDSVGNISACVPIGLDYVLDTQSPTVIINQASTQLDPTKTLPIVYDVTFSEAIDPGTFTVADMVSTGTITTGTMTILNSGDDTNFTIFFDQPSNGGTTVLDIPALAVDDLAGNQSVASTSSDNSVLYDCLPPAMIEDLYHGPITQTTTDLFWSEPFDNGCAITDYFMEYKAAGGAWTEFPDGTSTDPLGFITGLTPNTDYEYRVRAYNGLFGPYSNIESGPTKPVNPFFDPTDYKVINLLGAYDSQVVALEDSSDIYITNDINVAPTLLTSQNGGGTHRFPSSQGEILVSDKPIFSAGKVGNLSSGCSGTGNALWISPLWAEKTLLFGASRNNPITIWVYSFEPSNTVNVYRNNVLAATIPNMAENSFTSVSVNGIGSFRVEGTGFIGVIRTGTAFVDVMPALPKSTRILGYPSNSGLLGTVGTAVNATVYHSNGNTVPLIVNPTAFTSIAPQGTPTTLYRSETVFVEADDLISANNTADSNGCASSPFAPIQTMARRYATNVLSDWIAFSSIYPADIKMTRPNGTQAVFSLARTGTGPFALKSPYKYYLENIDAGTRFEGIGVTDRFSMWYQPDTFDGAGRYDETIIYGYK